LQIPWGFFRKSRETEGYRLFRAVISEMEGSDESAYAPNQYAIGSETYGHDFK
jgi:hypothetical protein